MDIQHLRYFMAVAKATSLTKAAQELFITQPALSKAIKKLEQDLQVKLFDKQDNHLLLTDAGKALLVKAAPLIAEFDSIPEAISDVKSKATGNVRIGVPMLISFFYLCDILLGFKQEYPGINLDIIEIGDDSIVKQTLQGDMDIGIVTRPVSSTQFISIPIYSNQVVAFIPQSNPLANKKYVEFKDLQGIPLHMFSSDFSLYGQVLNGCQQAGFNPIVSSTSSQRYFLVDMAISTNGVAIMPEPLIRDMQTDAPRTQFFFDHKGLGKPRSQVEQQYYPNMCVKSFVPDFPWTINLILKKNRYQTYAMQEIINYIQTCFTQMQ